MKKKLLMVLAFIIIMVPFGALGKTVISDKELDEVTAEDGVTVDLSVLTFGTVKTAATISWGDGNGYGTTYTSVGFMGMTDVDTEGSNFATFSGTPTQIDVGSSPTATSLIIDPQDVAVGPLIVNATMKVGTSADLGGTQEMGRVNMQALKASITADRIQISAH